MRSASVLIALAGLAVFSMGFIKLAQNGIVKSVTEQYANKLTRHDKSLGAGEELDFTTVYGAKAILLKYANSNVMTITQPEIDRATRTTQLITRKDNTRKAQFPAQNAERAIKLLLGMISTTPLTEEFKESAWQKIKECKKGGVIIDVDYTGNNYMKEDGFSFGISVMAVDCKPAVIEVATFNRVKGGDFKKQEYMKYVKYLKEGRFVDSTVTEPITLKIPTIVDEDLKETIQKVALFELQKDLAAFASTN